MQKYIASLLFSLVLPLSLFAQDNSLRGEIINENGLPLVSSTVVLLNPADSTMQYFSVSGTDGKFLIRNIKPGKYLMQTAFIGYETYYKPLQIPASDGGNLGYIPLSPKVVSLDEVTVSGERIPLRIKEDTLEYDAKAFKIKPDAVVEDLLRKMPGIEIDRAGNIKALGEDVRNVLVDGKEFFGNDPKVATKNLPANAIDKVQLYNKKSEESEFTGIADGERNQTVNLVLDEDKKDGVFGDIMAGGGTENHYQANGKVYKFSEKNQVAALGMINNINNYGFSFGDYLSFTGGIANISHGEGGISMGGGGFPINFGETVPGFATSGAAGFNFSHSKSKNQRIFISYIGSGSKKVLDETSKTTSYNETGSFIQNVESSQIQRDTSHSINFGIRNIFRETNNIIVNGSLSMNTGYIPLSSTLNSFQDNLPVNTLERTSSDMSDRLSGNISGSYQKRINEGNTIVKLSGKGSYTNSNSETRFTNRTIFTNPFSDTELNQYQDNRIISASYNGGLSLTQKLGKLIYMEATINAGKSDESLVRSQGNTAGGDVQVDSLSPDFTKIDQWLRPSLTLKRTNDKTTLVLTLEYSLGSYNTKLLPFSPEEKTYAFLQPRLSWEYEYKTGRRIMMRYSTMSRNPSVNQLLPVVNNFNSLSLFYGNRNLEPEYTHTGNISWWIFDQFSFTSLLSSVNASYTTNKINYSRQVDSQLGQVVSLVNVESDLTLGGSIDFSTPIRPLGIKTNLSIDESYNSGINIVNGLNNEITNLTHRLSLTFDNRKKEKWDINTGLGLTYTDARYSIQDNLNNIYTDISWFGEIRYNPNDRLDFNVSADVTNYTAKSFEESQIIPLIGAGVTYLFLKDKRGALTLTGFDLLNRNTGYKRVSELNYLRESRSNIIGRYVMLSFKWKLNKFGGNNSGMNIEIKKR